MQNISITGELGQRGGKTRGKGPRATCKGQGIINEELRKRGKECRMTESDRRSQQQGSDNKRNGNH